METNPANAPDKGKAERTLIPMSLPHLKLSVPELPGYHLHWMRGDAQRILQAQNAGYEFVEKDEVDLNGFGVAGSLDEEPGSDLGSRVSVFADADGGRLYLMKLKNEYWEHYEELKAQNQERIAAQIRGDKGFTAPGLDGSNRYTGTGNRNIFQPNRRAK